jgi:hypothetical protein
MPLRAAWPDEGNPFPIQDGQCAAARSGTPTGNRPTQEFVTLRFCFGMWWRRAAFALNGMVGAQINKGCRPISANPTPPTSDPRNNAGGDRGCHRCPRSEPHVGVGTPDLRPHRMNSVELGLLRPSHRSMQHSRPGLQQVVPGNGGKNIRLRHVLVQNRYCLGIVASKRERHREILPYPW